jgi:hypothetical protein
MEFSRPKFPAVKWYLTLDCKFVVVDSKSWSLIENFGVLNIETHLRRKQPRGVIYTRPGEEPCASLIPPFKAVLDQYKANKPSRAKMMVYYFIGGRLAHQIKRVVDLKKVDFVKSNVYSNRYGSVTQVLVPFHVHQNLIEIAEIADSV